MDEVHIKDIVEMWINDVLAGLIDRLDITLEETSSHGAAPFSYIMGIYLKGERESGRMIAGKIMKPEIILFNADDEYSVDDFPIEDPAAGEKLRAHVENYLEKWGNG